MTDDEIIAAFEADDELYLFYRRSKTPRQTLRKFIQSNRETAEAAITAQRKA
jgi:hypothetical protein